MINVGPPDLPPPPRSLPNQGWENCSLRSKRFRLVWEEINTEDFAPFFSRSLTLVPRSFLLNGTETLATRATIFPSLIWEGAGGGCVVPFYFVQDCRRIMGVLIRRREFNLGGFSYIFPLMELKFIFAKNWTLTLVNYVKPSRPHQEKK